MIVGTMQVQDGLNRETNITEYERNGTLVLSMIVNVLERRQQERHTTHQWYQYLRRNDRIQPVVCR